jgi:hypothetical protein
MNTIGNSLTQVMSGLNLSFEGILETKCGMVSWTKEVVL